MASNHYQKTFVGLILLMVASATMSAQGLGDFFSDGTNGYRILLAEDGTPTTEVRLIGHISEGTFDWSYYGFEYVPDEVEHEGKTYQVVEFGPFSRHETSLSQLRFGKNMRKIDISKQDFGLERGFEVAEENQHYKTIDNILYSKDGKTLVMCSSGFNPYRTTITIPDGVETIGKEALAWCYYIKIDELPKTLKTIGRRAFYYFSNIPKDFVLPEGIKTIEPEAFYSSPIQRLTLPSTLEVLGDIWGMWRLKTLVCLAPTPPATTGTTSDGVEFQWFESWDSYCQNVVLMVPKGSKELYQQDPVWGLFKRIMEVGEEICEEAQS